MRFTVIIKFRIIYIVIDVVVQGSGNKFGHILSTVAGAAYHGRACIETCGKIPSFVFQRVNINEQLEVVHVWLTNHLNLLVNLKACHLLQFLCHEVKTGATVFINRILVITHIHVEIQWHLKVRYPVESGSYAKHVIDSGLNSETYAGGSCIESYLEIRVKDKSPGSQIAY